MAIHNSKYREEVRTMERGTVEERKVLVVDDEAGLRRNLHFGLAQHGFRTDDVEDGLSALRLIDSSYDKGTPYDYVISDIKLPDINGLKLLEIIKSKYVGLPVIMISGYGTEITSEVVSTKRGAAYLPKPFLVEELAAVLNQVAPNKAQAVQPAAETTPKTSTSSYAMINVEPDADVLGIFRQLYVMDNVVYCDAVRDGYDIALLLNAESNEALKDIVKDKIAQIPGVAEIDTCTVTKPSIEDSIGNFIKDYEARKSIYAQEDRARRLDYALTAYVMVEVDKSRFHQVYPVLYFLDNVISCDATEGTYDTVLMIQSPTFKEMERFVREEVSTINGVVRAKVLNIINMFPL